MNKDKAAKKLGFNPSQLNYLDEMLRYFKSLKTLPATATETMLIGLAERASASASKRKSRSKDSDES